MLQDPTGAPPLSKTYPVQLVTRQRLIPVFEIAEKKSKKKYTRVI